MLLVWTATDADTNHERDAMNHINLAELHKNTNAKRAYGVGWRVLRDALLNDEIAEQDLKRAQELLILWQNIDARRV